MIEMTKTLEVEIYNPSYKLRDYEMLFLQNEIIALTGVEPSLDIEKNRYTLRLDSNFNLSKLELLT